MRGRLPITGTYVGTGAALTLPPLGGFKPVTMIIFNETDGFMCAQYVAGMADAAYYKTVAAGTQTLVTTNGITLGSAGLITIGSDAGLNTAAKTYRYVCY